MKREQPYREGMPAKYSKGLSKSMARRRAAAQRLRTKKYKEGKMNSADYEEKLPGD